MTAIETAIRDAVEKGGYGEKPSPAISRNKETIAWYVQSSVFLDPSFWSALGKARGWSYSDETCDHQPLSIPCYHEYKNKWHEFIDHLAEGKDAESFFASL
jgi:hypothetical protein